MKHSHCRPLRLKLICSHLTSITSLRNNVLFNLIHTYMPLMILASTGLISLLSLQDYCENCWVCSSTILLSSQSWLFYQHQDPTQKHPLTPEEKVEVTGMQSIRHRWETSGPSEDTTNTVSIHSTHPNRCALCIYYKNKQTGSNTLVEGRWISFHPLKWKVSISLALLKKKMLLSALSTLHDLCSVAISTYMRVSPVETHSAETPKWAF